MMLLKQGVIHEGLQPEMYYALGTAAALKSNMFGLNMVVTALLDGEHNPGSLHPRGQAADLRTHDLKPDEIKEWFMAMNSELNPLGFDVVPEGGADPVTPFTTGAHIHVEFQPKEGETFFHMVSA